MDALAGKYRLIPRRGPRHYSIQTASAETQKFFNQGLDLTREFDAAWANADVTSKVEEI